MRRIHISGMFDSPEDDSDSFDCLLSDSCNDGENPAFLHGTNWLSMIDSVDVATECCRKAEQLVLGWDSWKAEVYESEREDPALNNPARATIYILGRDWHSDD